MGTPRILVVDDERAFRTLLCEELGHLGYAVLDVETGADALDELAQADYDVVLLDLRLHGEDGLSVLQAILGLEPRPEVIMLTGHGTIDTAIQAMKIGACDFLQKPCNMDALEVAIQKAYEHRLLARENQALRKLVGLRRPSDLLVGSSEAMQRVKALALRVAPSDAPVLIQGPSGTGKELVATLIHEASGRADKPFIPVNCGALHEQLLASELFGHERGAFTGATARKHGLFEVADSGTLFLDEIGEMAPPVQVSLLRVLESGEIRRLGSSVSKHVNVRVISATNRELGQAVQHGVFREDLYYRLNTIEIRVPPLADRIEDIPDLVDCFLSQANRTHSIREVDPRVWEMFRRYAWPGNVRELRNIIERAMVLCAGPTLTLADVPKLSGLPATSEQAQEQEGAPVSLEEVERRHIERILAQFEGNKTQAARALGITPKTLYNKLQSYKEADERAKITRSGL